MKILNKYIKNPSTPLNPDEIDGIPFYDVKHIVKTREDLENILLSTKVIFENKEELLSFFDMLLRFGFKENAITYFEELLSPEDYDLINGFNDLLQ